MFNISALKLNVLNLGAREAVNLGAYKNVQFKRKRRRWIRLNIKVFSSDILSILNFSDGAAQFHNGQEFFHSGQEFFELYSVFRTFFRPSRL